MTIAVFDTPGIKNTLEGSYILLSDRFVYRLFVLSTNKGGPHLIYQIWMSWVDIALDE